MVGEDAAIDTPRMAGRRGLAGTALVHKVRSDDRSRVAIGCIRLCLEWNRAGRHRWCTKYCRQLHTHHLASLPKPHALQLLVVQYNVQLACQSALCERAVACCLLRWLLHLQIAGAAAAACAPLAAVAELARSVASRCATLGVALSGCTLPGHPPNTRCGAQQGTGWVWFRLLIWCTAQCMAARGSSQVHAWNHMEPSG